MIGTMQATAAPRPIQAGATPCSLSVIQKTNVVASISARRFCPPVNGVVGGAVSDRVVVGRSSRNRNQERNKQVTKLKDPATVR